MFRNKVSFTQTPQFHTSVPHKDHIFSAPKIPQFNTEIPQFNTKTPQFHTTYKELFLVLGMC